jgi:hypothetical protein
LAGIVRASILMCIGGLGPCLHHCLAHNVRN